MTDSITGLIQRINKLLEAIITSTDVITAIGEVNTRLITTNTTLAITNTTLATTNTTLVATNALLTIIDTVLDNTLIQVASKINRIKGAANYGRAITYYTTTDNPTVIVHTGTTLIGVETTIETITYTNAVAGDFRITNIIYS